jgi:hypothetical protein
MEPAVYGQHLDANGNAMWPSNGKEIYLADDYDIAAYKLSPGKTALYSCGFKGDSHSSLIRCSRSILMQMEIRYGLHPN